MKKYLIKIFYGDEVVHTVPYTTATIADAERRARNLRDWFLADRYELEMID